MDDLRMEFLKKFKELFPNATYIYAQAEKGRFIVVQNFLKDKTGISDLCEMLENLQNPEQGLHVDGFR